jgi:hypothetical protein
VTATLNELEPLVLSEALTDGQPLPRDGGVA